MDNRCRLLLVWVFVIAGASISAAQSCSGRCASGLDSSQPCQCNTACTTYGDCCLDYLNQCVSGQTCSDFSALTEYFWTNDKNRLTTSQYTLNWQTQVSSSSTTDQSGSKFFTYVDETTMNARATFSAFIAILDNFYPYTGTTDSISTAEQAEIDKFYGLLTPTLIFNKLYAYLRCRGLVSSVTDFKTKFYLLWFNLYPRSSSKPTVLDSCGFEHVMVGELSSTTSVGGFHSWIQFYREEKASRLNYYGYVRRVAVQPYVAGAKFAWKPSQASSEAAKSMGSFFIGTSPEFDLALYTACSFQYTDAICSVKLNGEAYSIQTWDIAHVTGLQVGSAYPSI